MAQCVGESLLSVALEETPPSTPLSFAVTSAVPSYQAFQSQMSWNFSPLISRRQPTFASLEPVTESVSVTATCALGF